MLPGGIYAMVSEMPPARFPLLACCIGNALNNGLRVSIITAGSPESFLERLVSLGLEMVPPALESGQLTLFSVRENFAKNIFRFGTEYFARELSFFGIPEDSLLIFDQADELLGLHDISLALEQMDSLQTWFAEQRTTALLVFNRVAATSVGMGTLHGLMDRLSGIVRLSGEREGLGLVFDYWQSPEGTVASRHFPLTPQESGLYRVSARQSAAVNDSSLTSSEDAEPHFFFMDPDLAGLAKTLPGIWRQIDSLVGMLHATRGLNSPTVILSFLRGSELRPLAEAVHTLRLSLGRRARIIVREKDASLRYQNEALLLRLGTNLIVHRDVPPSRLPLLLDSLRGQIFDRDVDINFDAALTSVLPSGLRGYLPPARFVREVDSVLERSGVLSIPCSLVVGTPAQDTSPPDIIRRVNMARPGDLITADHEFCYIFLSGCPESNVLMAVERVLGQSIGAAFIETRFIITAHELRAELDAIQRQAERDNSLPDHSPIASTDHTPAPVQVTEAVHSAPQPIATPTPQPAAAETIQHAAPKFVPLAELSRQVGMPKAPEADEEASRSTVLPVNHSPEIAVIAPEPPEPVAPAIDDPRLRFRYGGDLKEVSVYGKAAAPRASRVLPRGAR